MKILNYKLKIIIISLLIIIYLIVKPYINFVNKVLNISIIKTLISKDSLKIYDNQVNILLLGISGGHHDGPNLSDSNIVINYNFKTNQLTTISIPRDLWSPTLENKINSAYAYGEAKKPGSGGFILAKAEMAAVIGLPIQYAAVIDFQQFKKLIDFLGGIDVEVENSFIDEKFPIAGKENDDCNGDKTYACRYETISFTKGIISMNGETALKFTRSRNAQGDEGTDFAREKRQQKVIEAVKNKLINLLKNPNLKTYKEVYQILNNLIKRDITNQQAAIIAKNIILKRNFHQKKILLSEDFFDNPPLWDNRYQGLWVLVPKNEDYSLIHQYILCNLKNSGNCENLKNKGKKN